MDFNLHNCESELYIYFYAIENSLVAFRETYNLEMPTTLSPPFPAAQEITPDSSAYNRLIMSITQIGKPPASPPPPPHTPPGPVPSRRPSSPAECFCGWFTRFCGWFTRFYCWFTRLYCWFTPMTTSNSPCYGKSSSSSLTHGKTSDFNCHYIAQGLCNHCRNRNDSKRPSDPPPPLSNIAVAASAKSPPSMTLASYWYYNLLITRIHCLEEEQLQIEEPNVIKRVVGHSCTLIRNVFLLLES